MISNRAAQWMAARNLHYGWVVAITTFLTMLATAGAMGSAGVMIQPLHQEFGWDIADISSAMAVRLLLFGLLAPFAAAFMNHFGIRQVVTTALALILGGIVVSLFMTEVWQLVALWGIVIGVGTGMTAMVLGATVASRWFSQRRGLVMGMLSASNATGQLVFLPLLADLSETYGWRTALALTAFAISAAMILVLALMRDHPADVGLPAYGETTVSRSPKQDHKLLTTLISPITTLKSASASGTFWVLFGTFFVCGLSTNGLIQTHWISICGDFGMAPLAAASTLAVLGIFDFFGTIMSGWLSDRYDNRILLFWYYGLRGLSLIYLSVSGFSFYELSAFAVFYGLDWIATVPPTVKLAADKFGREKAGMVFGWVFTGHQLGAATAAYGAGYLKSGFNTYMPALQIAGVMCMIAAVSVLLLRKPGTAKLVPQPA
ncbi:Monocarboxylate permease, transmembrane transport protein of the MFS family [Neorhizobium galegae bv. officinalis bv. officinalis str. HAMBI 1141]|uniref:Monocarboxylate permease, transmembrane transport protein of the MFS family n=1 Tax=Neorhizobium galegae bv. officinalis bv. officinalis str. HAMBI 1141 TaxID=1028801 RepID=A0A068TBK4_NEOGA|nr:MULTISPECIES: MFS transporter [Neorhizobium]MCJ9754573.1 MFS transporter [Neorhizobium sp. BETTINA12A]CDN55474.1 Monocarboxylate permease, transmembrane transport protein of the MFS family [Neorhizobium galegae bv. officinalis bv. officinalis str. HAMBI 1141]